MNSLYYCIMLVDDDAVTNFLHKHILEDLQICQQITVCHNGKEAWQYLQEHYITADHQWQIQEPILILLDINMPIMNADVERV